MYNVNNEKLPTPINSTIRKPQDYVIFVTFPHHILYGFSQIKTLLFVLHLFHTFTQIHENCVDQNTIGAQNQTISQCHRISLHYPKGVFLSIFELNGMAKFGINLTLTKFFVLYSDQNCHIDHVSVYDLFYQPVGKFCGYRPPWSILSFFEKIYISFQTTQKFVVEIQFQIVEKYLYGTFYSSVFGHLLKEPWNRYQKGNGNYTTYRKLTLSLQYQTSNYRGFIFYYWTWQGFPGTVTEIQARNKHHDASSLTLYKGLPNIWDPVSQLVLSKHDAFIIQKKESKINLLHFMIGISLKVPENKITMIGNDIIVIFNSVFNERSLQTLIFKSFGPFGISIPKWQQFYQLYRYTKKTKEKKGIRENCQI